MRGGVGHPCIKCCYHDPPEMDHNLHGSIMVLEVELHHGCPDSDHRSPRVVKLVMGLYHGNQMVVELKFGLH